MTASVLLIRHPESAWNQRGRYQGQIDTPLSYLGLIQASLVARRLRRERIDAVLCSPLHRARVLADVIARVHRLIPQVDHRLTEIGHGIWEGLFRHEVEQRFPDMYRTWQEAPHTVTFPGGESLRAVHDRAVPVVADVLAQPGDGHTVIVTHDVVARLVVAAAQERSLEAFGQVSLENAGITTLTGPHLAGSLRHLNDTTHLGMRRVSIGGQAL